MTTVLAPLGKPRTSPALRLELVALLVATVVVVFGTAMTQEAALVRALRQAGSPALRGAGDVRTTVMLSTALLLVPFYVLHALRRFQRGAGDGLMLAAVMMLCGIGLMTMLSVRDPLRDQLLVLPFARGVFLGGIAAAAAMSTDWERVRSFAYLPLLAAVGLSILLIVFGAGPGRSGVKVNLWGGQPVDVIRLLEVAFIAAYLGSRWEYLRSLQDPDVGRTKLMAGVYIPPLDYLLPLLLGVTAALVFYVAQKDLGPALIMACVFLAMYAVACGRVGLAVGGLAALVGAFWLGYELGIPSTVRSRVAIWLSPWENGLRGGDQVAQGLWSLATGGVAGTGPGLGDAQLVPAAHTDFVLAVIGEELGFVGLCAVLLLYAVVIWRAFKIALHAAGDYSRFLALGIALGLAFQLLLIGGGILALVPLSGVVTPFLSYGKSATIVSFASIGILLSIANRASPVEAPAFRMPLRYLSIALASLAFVVAARAFQVQVISANATMARPVLALLADGTYRFQDNPRLVAAARDLIPRGRILDRRGVPLAFNRDPEGPDSESARTCGDGNRCYPLGGRTYHVLGDLRTERDWAASNTSFLERDAAPRLRGFDDHARPVTVARPGGQDPIVVLRRDYSDLIPLVRFRGRPDHPSVQRVLHRARDLRVTIDARLQAAVADLLGERLANGRHERAAVIVLDPATREVLASVSYPWPDLDADVVAPEARLDRVRYGLYPPGSAFKLVTAIAALKRGPGVAQRAFACERLPGGAAGRRIPGWSRPIRDDVLDPAPHGEVTLTHGLTVSCNAYFAQLAVALGSQALTETAREFDISVAARDDRARLRATLPFAGFGQGEVLTTPTRLAQVVASIASGGTLMPLQWVLDPEPSDVPRRRVMSPAAADRLARAMREVVTSGTGRVVRANATAIAGKTGTAEVEGQPSHAWFAGFAPYRTRGRQIAFVVLVENGGYGARAAAPIAGAIVDIARQLRIIE
jgi:cell division protein FtsW (lipid II flippase)